MQLILKENGKTVISTNRFLIKKDSEEIVWYDDARILSIQLDAEAISICLNSLNNLRG